MSTLNTGKRLLHEVKKIISKCLQNYSLFINLVLISTLFFFAKSKGYDKQNKVILDLKKSKSELLFREIRN